MRPFHREGNAGPKLFRESQANQKYFTLGDQRLRCSSEVRRTPLHFAGEDGQQAQLSQRQGGKLVGPGLV